MIATTRDGCDLSSEALHSKPSENGTWFTRLVEQSSLKNGIVSEMAMLRDEGIVLRLFQLYPVNGQ